MLFHNFFIICYLEKAQSFFFSSLTSFFVSKNFQTKNLKCSIRARQREQGNEISITRRSSCIILQYAHVLQNKCTKLQPTLLFVRSLIKTWHHYQQWNSTSQKEINNTDSIIRKNICIVYLVKTNPVLFFFNSSQKTFCWNHYSLLEVSYFYPN